MKCLYLVRDVGQILYCSCSTVLTRSYWFCLIWLLYLIRSLIKNSRRFKPTSIQYHT